MVECHAGVSWKQPHPELALTPGSLALPTRGSLMPSACSKAPEPHQAPHTGWSEPQGMDQVAEGFTAESHALAPQARCPNTCGLTA